MDAMTLRREVSQADRDLQTPALAASLIDVSMGKSANQRGERRVRFHYAAPARMRYEPGGPEAETGCKLPVA
jgi:hypothetical protein